MRTKEACATRLSFIIAMMVSAAIGVWLPAVPAHAVNLLIQANNATCVSINAGSTATVNIPTGTFNCGIIISSRPNTTAQVLALVSSGSQNQVVIKNVVIKNNLGSGVAVTITANHLFSSTVVASPAQRAYSMGLNGSFTRLVNGTAALAGGNAITKTGSYVYSCSGCTDQIGGGLFESVPPIGYTVPSVGSTSLNTIPIPAPSLSESGSRNCASFGKSCGPGETLQTVVQIFLGKTGDLVTIPGGDHTVAGGCGKKADPNCDPTAFTNAILGALSAAAVLQQNTPNPSVNPNDSGFLAVNLICNPAFRCETVDQGSLRFGPAGAQPKSVQLRDVNNDGIVDLKATFDNQQTGIVCGGENMTTLSGTNTFPGFGLLEFDAPVGFNIAGCQ